MMRFFFCGLLFLSLSLPAAHAQQPSAQPGCALEKTDYYRCNHDAFRHMLAVAKTVRIDTGRMDRFGQGQMEKLVDGLGKQIAAPEQRADLIFELEWIDRSGRIDFGPGDVALARLNVYDPSRGSGERGLVWVETLSGQEDLPWPSIVVNLIRQFRSHAL